MSLDRWMVVQKMAVAATFVAYASMVAHAFGCSGGVAPGVVQAGVASIETAICVLNTYSTDKAAGKSDGDAIADTITRCATDAATIAKVLDASHAAQLRMSARTVDGGAQ